MNIRTVFDFNKALAHGPYAWPGGYPLYFICADGEALSFKAAEAEAELIRDAIISEDMRSEWNVIGLDVNYEDGQLYCAHTNERIESAYAEDEAQRPETPSVSEWENMPQAKRDEYNAAIRALNGSAD
jgi:hypothetical protein